jgi:membrane-bound lytic murein transglycosylase A
VTPAQPTPTGRWRQRAALINRGSIKKNRVPLTRIFILTALLSGLTACAQLAAVLPPSQQPAPTSSGPAQLFLIAQTFKSLPGWKADQHSVALQPFLKSCEKLRALPPDQALGKNSEMGHVKDWLPICKDAARVRAGNDTDARYFFESRFQAYLAVNDFNRNGLFTGYYEPELRGSWKPDNRFRVAIYSRPKDVIGSDLGQFDDKWSGQQIAGRFDGEQFIPYYDRAEIEAGALNGRQLEILWVDDAIDAFFLHIQGSGRVLLPDGSHIRLGYGGRNGRPYTAVGRELVGAGIMRLKDVTMPAIRRWMVDNPVAAQAVMRKNRSFVFFKVLKTNGPLGAQGVVLTAGRSLAVDRQFIPLGIPMWLVTTDPGTRPTQPLRRVVIAQDTGSAIKGPVRGDLFWGFGAAAGDKAGVMKQQGSYYLLLPRGLAPKPTS